MAEIRSAASTYLYGKDLNALGLKLELDLELETRELKPETRARMHNFSFIVLASPPSSR